MWKTNSVLYQFIELTSFYGMYIAPENRRKVTSTLRWLLGTALCVSLFPCSVRFPRVSHVHIRDTFPLSQMVYIFRDSEPNSMDQFGAIYFLFGSLGVSSQVLIFCSENESLDEIMSAVDSLEEKGK